MRLCGGCGTRLNEHVVCPTCGAVMYENNNASAQRSIYIIGSMRNPRVPLVAKALRAIGWDAYDDWFASGPESDDNWQKYERERGHTYIEAATGHHSRQVFKDDKYHLDRCDCAIMVMKAGNSCHSEFGYVARTKPAYILLNGEPERYEIMPPGFATKIFVTVEEMLEYLK